MPVTIATGANLQACLAPLLPPETQRARRQVTSKVRTGRRLTCGVPAALLTRSLGASYTGLVFCDSHMGCSYCRAWGSPREDFTCNLAPARASSSGGPAPSKCSRTQSLRISPFRNAKFRSLQGFFCPAWGRHTESVLCVLRGAITPNRSSASCVGPSYHIRPLPGFRISLSCLVLWPQGSSCGQLPGEPSRPTRLPSAHREAVGF